MNTVHQKRIDTALGVPLLAILKPLVVGMGWLLRRDHSLRPRGRVVVVKMLGGGSLVLALPALAGVRRAHPDRRLVLLTTRGLAPFAHTLGVFDEVVAIDTRSLARLVLSSARAWGKVLCPDTVVDLEVYSKLTTVFSVLTCARNRLGFYLESVLWRRPMQTHLVFFNPSAPRHLFYERLLGLLGAEPASDADCREQVQRSIGLSPAGEPAEDAIAVGVGCSSLSPERMFDPDQWATVFRERLRAQPELRAHAFRVLGAADEAPIASEVIARLRQDGFSGPLTNLCGAQDLAASLRALAAAREYWGIDSALLHYARLFGLRTVSFWGPTSPSVLLRPGSIDAEIHYRGIPCSPCVHVTELAPCAGRNLCMASLVRPLSEAELREIVPVVTSASRWRSP
jgi:ADP-heptose:LPS heptosyltransferase